MASSSSTEKPVLRRILVAVVLACAASVLSVAPAHAGLRGCVTDREFARAEIGQTRFEVNRRIFGTTGVQVYLRHRSTGHIIEKRRYRACEGQHLQQLTLRFRDGRYYDARWTEFHS